MSNQNTYEQIESYLNGELQGDDLRKFEQQLIINKSLSDQVSLFKEMNTVLSDREALDIQNIIQEEGINYATQKKSPKILSLNFSKVIASAALLILLFAALFIWKNQLFTGNSDKELFAKYFETYSINESVRSSEIGQERMTLAISEYQKGNFEEAVLQLQNLTNEAPQDMRLKFYLAQAFLNLDSKNKAAAKNIFEVIIEDGKSIYVPASKWYLALILLDNGDRSTAKKTSGGYPGK